MSNSSGDIPGVIRIDDESELGTLPTLMPGTVAERITSDGHVWRYINTGSPTSAVRSALGWTQENVWIREQEFNYIASKRPGFVVSLPAAIAHVLAHPLSVHDNPRASGTVYFVAAADDLRTVGLVQSRRARFVDLVVEVRRVLGGTFLRVTHFSPATRSFGGRQLWP
jgi:hypothetical protein